MITKYLTFSNEDIEEAGRLIREGKLVAFPTETVYGLGANAFDENAIRSTYVAKGRPSDNPLIVHVWCKEQIVNEVASVISEDAEKIIDNLLPGSVTIVLPKKSTIPNCATAGLNTVAVRMPESQQARDFLRACRVPVTAPSANTSSRPSPTTWQTVKEDMDGKIAGILCGEPCKVGIESTVLDLTGEEIRILRPGVVTPDIIENVLGKKVRLITDPKEKVNSPGVKYKHYAPSVPMALELEADVGKLCNYYDDIVKQGKTPVLLVEDTTLYGSRNVYPIGKTDSEVAQNIFETLRILEKQYDYIVASYSSKSQFSVSILNRLTKSAGQNII